MTPAARRPPVRERGRAPSTSSAAPTATASGRSVSYTKNLQGDPSRLLLAFVDVKTKENVRFVLRGYIRLQDPHLLANSVTER